MCGEKVLMCCLFVCLYTEPAVQTQCVWGIYLYRCLSVQRYDLNVCGEYVVCLYIC